VTETIPAPTQVKYQSDPSLNAGAVRLISKARAGYRAKAQRTYLKNGTVVKTENLPSSYYRPQPASYTKGSGTASSSASSHGPSSQQPAAIPAPNDDVTPEGKPAA
jgi:uncharacterized protein YabE (DUF348 family)